MRIKHRTLHSVEHDANNFDLRFDPVADSVSINVTGNRAVVGYLSPDHDCRGDWYFDEYDQGEFYNIGDNRMKNYRPMDEDDIEELYKANPGRVFRISKYEHSLVRYFRMDDTSLTIPDRQWDCSEAIALYVAPDDTPDPKAYCDGVMKEFSDWCNGSIYGVCVEVFERVDADADWERVSDDACWGHIGYEWAEQALAEEMKAHEATE